MKELTGDQKNRSVEAMDGADTVPYEKMSELETSAERFDQPLRSCDDIKRKYIICSAQRAGSHLLGRLLINAGIGVPHEYFNPLHIRLLSNRWKLDLQDRKTYLRMLFARRTSPNGIWGTKLQWEFMQHCLPVRDELFGEARYIYLFRKDILAQAISLHISVVTGIWDFDGIKVSECRPDHKMGDDRSIAQCMQIIKNDDIFWKNFFAENRLSPLVICYEDFVKDQQNSVRQIAKMLDLDDTMFKVPPPEPKESHSAELDAIKEELIQRFRSRAF